MSAELNLADHEQRKPFITFRENNLANCAKFFCDCFVFKNQIRIKKVRNSH